MGYVTRRYNSKFNCSYSVCTLGFRVRTNFRVRVSFRVMNIDDAGTCVFPTKPDNVIYIIWVA